MPAWTLRLRGLVGGEPEALKEADIQRLVSDQISESDELETPAMVRKRSDVTSEIASVAVGIPVEGQVEVVTW